MSENEFQLFENNSDNLVGKIVEANTLESSGEIDKAITIYQEIASLDPNGNYGNVAKEALANLQNSDPSKLDKEFGDLPSSTENFFWQKLSLKIKVPLVAILLSALPVLVIGSIAYYITNKTIQQEVSETAFHRERRR